MTPSPAARRALLADPSLISLVYRHEHPVAAEEFSDTLEVWTVTARIDADLLTEEAAATSAATQADLDAVRDITVGRMVFVQTQMFGPDHPREAADAHSGDVARISESVLDAAEGEWSARSEKALAHPVGDLLVMDRAVLEPDWRGFGLSPALAAAAIRRLSNDCVAVVCEPGSADGREMTETEHAAAHTPVRPQTRSCGCLPLRPTGRARPPERNRVGGWASAVSGGRPVSACPGEVCRPVAESALPVRCWGPGQAARSDRCPAAGGGIRRWCSAAGALWKKGEGRGGVVGSGAAGAGAACGVACPRPPAQSACRHPHPLR
ncbi:hypothetical protein ACLIYM_02890 [Streptomyces fenghuangensis]